MKKLMMTMVLVFSTSVFAQEKLSDVAKEAQFQKNITAQINTISNMESKEQLINMVSKTCDKVSKQQKNIVDKVEVDTDCRKKLELIETLDFETVKHQMIAELQEIQSAGMHMFFLTRATADAIDHSYYMDAKIFNIFLLPVAIVVDVALLPFTFLSSLVTGF